MRYPQGPVATGSFVFGDEEADRILRVLRAIPHRRSGTKVRIECLREEPSILEAVRDDFGQSVPVTVQQLNNAEFNDKITILYERRLSSKPLGRAITIDTIGRFPGPPVVRVTWGTGKQRDIECEDVFPHYLKLAHGSRCRCSVLAIEEDILKLDDEFIFPSASVCAVTFQEEYAKHADADFDEVMSRIRRSINMIAGCRCRFA